MNKLREEENDDLIDGQEGIIDRATPRLEKILGTTHPVYVDHSGAEEKPTRKRKERSDKGKPKPVKPVAATLEVASKRIYALSERVAKAAAKMGTAKAEFEAAKTELQSYMDGL